MHRNGETTIFCSEGRDREREIRGPSSEKVRMCRLILILLMAGILVGRLLITLASACRQTADQCAVNCAVKA